MTARSVALVFGILLASLPSSAQAPFVIGTVNGPSTPEQLGAVNALAVLGDVDGDFVPDFVAGAPGWAAPHPTIPGATVAAVGKARVFSGATLTQIMEVSGTTNLQELGKSVANVGDVNGDGFNDFAVGAPMAGPTIPGQIPPPAQVQVWSVVGQTLLYTIIGGSGGFTSSNFGVSIAGVGDVGSLVGGVYSSTPDGVPDILVGASTGNSAAVYSGVDGSLLYAITAATINPPLPAPPLLNAGEDFGGTVAAAGDVSGDGIPDLLVCARSSALGGATSGAVFLLSGAGGSVIHVFVGAAGASLGRSAISVGDVTGDGKSEIAIGANLTDNGATDTGSVTLYDGSTHLALWTANGLATTDQLGYSVGRAGDVTGDGKPDVIAGAAGSDVGASNTGSIALLDGLTGTRLGTYNGLVLSDTLGRSCAGFGDFNGDGTPDVLAGAPNADIGGSSTGTVTIVSFGPWLRPSAAGATPGVGGTFDAIRINGSAGGPPRRVDLTAFQPLTASFNQPPTFGIPAPLYCFGMIGGVPVASDEYFYPVLGTMCFAPPILNPADPRLFLAFNSFVAFEPGALIPNAPSGTWSVPLPAGLPAGFIAALSGATWNGTNYYRSNTVLIDVH